jgi:anti-anti-sigma factor
VDTGDDVDSQHDYLSATVRSSDGGATTVLLEGELDLMGSSVLESVISRLGPQTSLVLDLRGVEFIDSAGVRALILLTRDADVALANPSRAVRHTFEVARVLHLLDPN